MLRFETVGLKPGETIFVPSEIVEESRHYAHWLKVAAKRSGVSSVRVEFDPMTCVYKIECLPIKEESNADD